MAQFQKYKEDFILMAEAGFIAVNQADEDSAQKLFKAAAILNPENALPKIGLGYLHLCKLELKQACRAFEDILAKDPYNDMAKTFLGIALSLTPTDVAKGEKYLTETAHKTKDPMVKTLADSALKFVDEFVKKAPSPAQLQKGGQQPPRKNA